ncbi:MAG: DUF669 domain-containing protein [Bryobacteraceae bacterium]|nr:DUF669 domain-containing protein [Bryobacteraceae bacterium]MCX7605210.1 DUF669 domain-containing protein [Bryobacteraceae bacterium]
MNHQSSETEPGIDLSIYDEDYSLADPPRAGQSAPADEIPDGAYEASIEGVHISRTATTGNPMVLWKLRILGPSCQGRAVTKVRVITPKTLAFLKRDLERLDMHLERLSDLPARAGELVDRQVRIFKKANPERRWTEVYFLGLAGTEDGQRGSPATDSWPAAQDDDLPF